MEDRNQVELYGRGHRLDRRGPGALDGRVVELPDSYEILESDEGLDLRAYGRILHKRLPTILIVFFILFTTILVVTLKQRSVYRTQVLLEIQKENPDIPTIKELYELEAVSDAYLRTQYNILASESLSRRVIEQLRLDTLPEFNSPRWWQIWPKTKKPSTAQTFAIGPVPAGGDRELSQRVLERFQDQLTIDPVNRSRLVTVRFDSRDPELAARVVNTLAADYVDQSLEARWQATQKAAEWLTQQLVGVKAKLEKSEDELQSYARHHGLVFLETDKGASQNVANERLQQLQEQLTKAQTERYEKEALYRLVQTGEYESLPGVFENKLIQDLSERLAELKREHAQLSTTFNADYPRVKEIQSQIDEIEGSLREERQRAADRIANDYSAAVRRENLVQQGLGEQQKQVSLIAEKSVQYSILKREVETNKQLYEGLLQRLKEAGVSAALKASNIRVVDAAEPPKKPTKPNLPLNLALAVTLGLALGAGAAFFEEHLDNSLKTSEDVERYLGLPALALIPSVESLNGRRGAVYGVYGRRSKALPEGNGKPATAVAGWYRIDATAQDHSALAEVFRSLRTSFLLSTAERPPRTLLVSSSQPSEGKTTVSSNLAISLAQLGHRVLLIDGDMRRPSVRKVFQLDNGLGLVSYLTGQQDWRAVVQPTGQAGLDALLCGPVPPNPAELLSSERMRTLLGEAKAEYQFVVVDSPPLLNVADSRILATMVEGVVLVVKGGVTPRELAQRAQAYARDVGANLIGVVLNNLDVRGSDDYYRYYHYNYYGSEEHAKGEETP